MGGQAYSLSRLIRSLSTEPTDTTRTASDTSIIALKDICSLRQRSIRKFARALDDIANRYEGDGDEEADDVIDLENLQVIEDRGYIINRFSRQSELSQSSSTSFNKGKGRADSSPDLLDILNPSLVDESDGWVDEEEDHDQDENDDQDSLVGNDEDYNNHGENNDDTLNSASDSSSSALSPSPSPSSSKISFKEKSPKRKKLTQFNSKHSNTMSDPVTIQSYPQRVMSKSSNYEDETMTNELFERLKRRVMERSSDITKHRLYKQSLKSHRDNPEPSRLSSPNSSSITSLSLSSALEPTKDMISPYLQRFLNPDYASRRAVRSYRFRESPEISVKIPPCTPTSGRKRRWMGNSGGDRISSNDRQETSIRKKRNRTSSFESSTLVRSPSDQARYNNTTYFSSSRPNRTSLDPNYDQDSTLLFSSDSFEPVFLFKSPYQLNDSDSQASTPTASKIKKLKCKHLQNQQKREGSSRRRQQQQEEEEDQFSRESSEDPLYLPPSSRKFKPKP